MKSIVTGSVFLSLILWFWVPQVKAQNNAFVCIWNESFKTCAADFNSASCRKNFVVDDTVCKKATTKKTCEASGSHSCIDSSSDVPSISEIENEGLKDFAFKDATLGKVIQVALPWVFGLAGIGLLLYLLYGGFHMMTSGGEPKALQEARGKITNALIGFFIVFIAYWIVQIIGRVFGLTDITSIFR